MHEYSLLNDAVKIDDTFLIHLYIYYLHGGYYNIIIDDIVNILISVFMMIFIKFIYSCIDFMGVFTNNGNQAINDFIHWEQITHFDVFMGISFTIFTIYIVFRIIQTGNNIKIYPKFKNFYNKTLNIQDTEIRTCDWSDIITKIIQKCHNTTNLNVYTATNRIMKIDNIIISLWDNKLFPFRYLNVLVEHNIKYCFLGPLQDSDNKITLKDKNNYKQKVKNRIFWTGVCSLCFLPFIVLFLIFYMIIQHGESFYNSPKLVANRSWTRISKWRFRFYNELPHLFENRMRLASEEMKDYFEQFNYRILEIVSRLIVFIVSSIFMLLIFIVFINENNLNNKGVFGLQPLLWHITICATILTIFRNYTKNNLSPHPKESLQNANEYLYLISESNIKMANLQRVKQKMSTYFQYHVVCLFLEIISIIITPFYYMPILYDKSDEICQFILDHIDEHYIMGNISIFSNFSKYVPDSISNNPKLKFSLDVFADEHPSWALDNIDHNDDSSLLNLPTNSINETIISINMNNE